MQTKSEKGFYGWKIVAVCFCLMFFSMGLIFNANGLFTKPICEELGYSRPQISLNMTLFSGGQMLIALFSGRIFSRFKVKQVMTVSAVVIAIATSGLAFAHSLPMFYICALLVGLSMGGICVVPISLLVSKWFNYRRGTAIGISMTGSGVGGMFFNTVMGYTIPHFGWRMSYLGGGILMAVVLIPLVVFVIRETPEEMGLKPLSNGEEEAFSDPGKAMDGITLQEAWRRPMFWTFLACGLVVNISFTAMCQNISTYLSDLGYTYSFAALIASFGMASLAIGKTTLGVIYDKTSPRFGTMFSACCSIAALAACVFANLKPMLIVYVLCTGMACAFGSVAFPLLTEVLFGHKDYASIYGIVTFASGIGGTVSPIITASFYDVTGTYKYAFLTMLICNTVATALYFKMMPSRRTTSAN